MARTPLQLSAPDSSITTLIGAALVAAGIMAAVAPARRASRLDVLGALQYQ